MIVVLEDNIYRIQRIVDEYHLSWEKKDVLITAYPLSVESWMRGKVIEQLFLDYELPPGAGDGLSFLRTLKKEQVKKVFITTGSNDAARQMYQYCREQGIDAERVRL